jgi:alkyl hydroperoxide reductase subunit F
MLDATLTDQLRGYLQRLVQPIELVASLDESPTSTEMASLLDQIASLSDLVTVVRSGHDARRPSFVVQRSGAPEVAVRFAGLPLGHELSSLVLALLQVGGHPPKVTDEVAAQARSLEGDLHFETYFSQSCQNCPDVVQALNVLAVLNPGVTHVAIDGASFGEEVDDRQVLAVPAVFLNGEPFAQGRMSIEEILGRLDIDAAAREVERMATKDVFDVLVVGGGPAGAAAAVYAARKGIRTGVAAERFGGQVLDTMGIENFVSVSHTEGPQLARALEQHVREHDVDVMVGVRASRLVPAGPDGLVEVAFDNGASLRARTVVVSTGARWRTMGVPGEDEYRNRGVTFCPHCDGPLFKGRRVAVIGGGNSGVEAAIDLAGIVAHVTLVEFDDRLRADEVLQRALRSLPNVDVVLGGRTTEVVGDGQRVTGIVVEHRSSGALEQLDLDGVFVQIGLLPNTDWLQGTVELSPRGEVVIDDRGQTSVAGVLAAGDCTTVPYKQIVIALGAGATAALSAFDHLIRSPVPAMIAA